MAWTPISIEVYIYYVLLGPLRGLLNNNAIDDFTISSLSAGYYINRLVFCTVTYYCRLPYCNLINSFPAVPIGFIPFTFLTIYSRSGPFKLVRPSPSKFLPSCNIRVVTPISYTVCLIPDFYNTNSVRLVEFDVFCFSRYG